MPDYDEFTHLHVEAVFEMNDNGQDRRRHTRDADTGRPDYHDPTAQFGGAPPARSALSLRLLLAIFGFLLFAVAAVWLAVVSGPVVLIVVFALVTVVALVDIVVVIQRKARGEPS